MKLRVGFQLRDAAKSLPVRGAWIEIPYRLPSDSGLPSLPVRGAWIEISRSDGASAEISSLPVRGAWIEITSGISYKSPS